MLLMNMVTIYNGGAYDAVYSSPGALPLAIDISPLLGLMWGQYTFHNAPKGLYTLARDNVPGWGEYNYRSPNGAE
jgi:hypothetical protein